MPLAVPLDIKQLHQMLHIAFPEVYQAAVNRDQVWLSLWEGDKRVKKLDAIPRRLSIVESAWEVKAVAGSFGWRIPKTIPKCPTIGVALTENAKPVVYVQISGYVPLPLGKDDWFEVPDFKASVNTRP